VNALHRYILLLFAALLAAWLGGCASTRITTACQDPDPASVPFRKALAVFQTAVVVLRVAAVEREQTYVPGRVYVVPGRYHHFWGYWN
jgi:hypothetical protein